MKNVLLFSAVVALMMLGITLKAQSTLLEITIIKNGVPLTDTLENGQIVTYDTSSDDAEQQDDEMDALYDDDLDAGWEGDPEDLHILITGLRFQNVALPKGATIDSAFLVLTAHEGKNSEDVAIITIAGEASDSPEPYNLESLITDRPETSAKVVWTVSEEWELWGSYKSVNLSAIITELVNRSGWSYGNSLALMLKGEDQGPSDVENAREFESFENIADPEDGGDGQNHPERRPKLQIYYSFPSSVFEAYIQVNGTPVTDTLENGQIITYDTSADDAEQQDDEMDALYDDDLDAGWEGDPEDLHILTTGLRFRDVNIPKGVTIDSAYLVITAHEAKSAEDVAIITIVGEASDAAQTYNFDNLITDRAETSSKIIWTVANEWELWGAYRSPDLKTIIQEVITRQGWATGNPIAIMLKGEDQGPSDIENAREFESFENIADPEDGGDGQNHPERRPKLVVYYSGSSSVGDSYQTFKTLNIFPNPASNGVLNMSFDNEAPTQVSIYDQSGKEVKAVNFEKAMNVSVDVNGLSKGIYVVKANHNNEFYSQKLIIR